ncbi:GNAT family N-acetyltransferase [Acinetobacter sp. NIPH 2377]|jgi:GNAT superfamily N-acetyltransferase|uniref:GNAT family N-acetyltransferase n=1 Tax=Acinetobacter terrestris TaxID=2529843 RepID=UPI00148FFC99|nr:GNAT family N-acetyltransferase [Acinetobacter terrestris]NNH35716.1 GNAT family N-acetyltransferase [Acinetobacter terrestris]
MITAHVESFEENLEYLKPLLPIHYKELALNQDKVPLSPQFDKYVATEKQGGLIFVTLRKAGEMVGYFIGFIAPGLHYSTCLTCQMDIFYVLPEHRGSGTGFQLFKFVEQQLKKRGVQRLFVGSKLHKDASWLFEKLNYTPVETYYSAWLGD